MAGLLEKRLSEQHPEFEEEKDTLPIPKRKKKESYSYAADDFSKTETDESNEEEQEACNSSYVSKEDIDALKEMDALIAEEEFHRESKRQKNVKRFFNVVLTISCLYLVLLIYGVTITEYQYDESGKVAPITVSVEDISNKNEYISVLGLYLQARSLYEKILTLDYRIAAGMEDTLSIAPEYETALDTVSSLTVQIDAATFSSKYNQVKNMLLTWVKTHIAAYCQYMSAAISKNNSDAAAEAIAAREVVESEFQLITQNIITFGEEINGYDLTDIKSWDPDTYIKTTIEGISE